MIPTEKRKAIYLLYTEGISIRKIAKQLSVDRNTVRMIIKEKGDMPNSVRSDIINLDSELILRLYGDCGGYIQRIHEKLNEEHNIKIAYSTLSKKIRELELGKPKNRRCEQVTGAI